VSGIASASIARRILTFVDHTVFDGSTACTQSTSFQNSDGKNLCNKTNNFHQQTDKLKRIVNNSAQSSFFSSFFFFSLQEDNQIPVRMKPEWQNINQVKSSLTQIRLPTLTFPASLMASMILTWSPKRLWLISEITTSTCFLPSPPNSHDQTNLRVVKPKVNNN